MLRIAQFAPMYYTIPPHGYGGVEKVIAEIGNGLHRLGHEITTYCVEGSSVHGRVRVTRKIPLRHDVGVFRHDIAAHFNALQDLVTECNDYDIIHFHTDILHLPFLSRINVPSVTTIHTQPNKNDARGFYSRFSNHPFVALSDSQRAHVPDINWNSTVYNGVDFKKLSSSFRKEGYLAYLGRINPDKGVDVAVRTAIAAGQKLLIGGKIDANHVDFFEREIVPFLDHPLIQFVGEVTEGDKARFLSGADALLFPIRWPEPFGLVMIEAMACGTPVVAFNAGSVPEIIDNHITGEIVDSEKDSSSCKVYKETLL